MTDLDNRHTRREAVAAIGASAALLASAKTVASKPSSDATRLNVTSPNGKLVAVLHLGTVTEPGPRWSVGREGEVLLEPSRLALVLADGRMIGPKARLISHRIMEIRENWSPPYGIAQSYDGSLNRLEAVFDYPRSHVQFAVHIVAHDDGVAVRYALLSAPKGRVSLSGETTHFQFPEGTRLWASRDEGEYADSRAGAIDPVAHPEQTKSTDHGAFADTPLLALLPSGVAMLVSESDRLHYPRLMLTPNGTPDGMVSHLMRFPGRTTGYSGPGDTHAAPIFDVETPFTTPWRVMLVAPDQPSLIGKAGLIATLATPNRLVDVGWIKPGRAFRIREPYTTQAALTAIDFAAKRKLDYVEFDAHWYGDGTDSSDATVPIAELDMPAILSAASAKGLGMILYVDRVPAMRQLDAIVKTYRQWGVAGIKFGFVWEGRQEDVDFIYDMVKLCGEHRLLVNLHDNLRPAGLERTLPNYIALEGVRGNEQFPTARHNVTLPFVRALSGPIDYTICYDHYKNQTTNAHQLAMSVVYYNPLTFLYWYDTPAKYAVGNWSALRWFDECPTSWDETIGLGGTVGEHVVAARRHGDRWFLGAMTNEQARNVDVSLAFLGEGRWSATIFADGAPASAANRTPVVITTRQVLASEKLTLNLASSGGQAIMFTRDA